MNINIKKLIKKISLVLLVSFLINVDFAHARSRRTLHSTAVALSSLVSSSSDIVHIHPGMEVYIDKSVDVKGLMISGTLKYDPVKANPYIEIKKSLLMLQELLSVELQCAV